jgi:ABC-type amino acid transport substrate-binding protein
MFIVLFVNPLAAQELSGTLQQIKKSGKIRVGYRQFRPPMSFLNKENKPDGYSVDLCRLIVTEVRNRLGADINVEFIPVTAENRFDDLSENKIDILCGATTKTLSRAEHVDFTELTFVTGASFMTLRGKNVRNNFTGKKIGVVKETTTAVALKELLQETGTEATIILFDEMDEGLNALIKGKIDALSADQIVLIGMASTAKNPEQFSIFPDLFSFEPFALAVRRNDADFRLVADRVISGLYRTKQIMKIYDKWVGQYTMGTPSAFEALIQLNATPE